MARISFVSNKTPLPWKWILGLGALSAFSLGGFLIASALTYRVGYPLDDAWIHQTYARNLAWYGEWSFVRGQPSAGSTAPFWSIWLAIGYWLRMSPYSWTFVSGWLLLWGVGLAGWWAAGRLLGNASVWGPWVGVFLVLEWHLVWAAGSGMETLFSGLLALIILGWLLKPPVRWGWIGALIGFSVWLRPDALTLLGPAFFVLLLSPPVSRDTWIKKGKKTVRLIAGFGVFFIPYLLFNEALAGSVWPNTFFAKQAEYAATREIPLIERYFDQVMLPLVGVGLVLAPGFVYLVLRAFSGRRWAVLAGALWVLGYLGLYAWRLPVTYQHGRYVIPVMPVFFVWGAAGLIQVLKPASPNAFPRILSRVTLAVSVLVLVLFWALGARAYARDVAVIESEMVKTAIWITAETDPETLIAAHDIGALGYFAQRPLLDLAGLVSPEVIPFIRDEDRLADFLDRHGAEYLVTFPGWYPSLVAQGELVYTTGGTYSPDLGGENMQVFKWPGSD